MKTLVYLSQEDFLFALDHFAQSIADKAVFLIGAHGEDAYNQGRDPMGLYAHFETQNYIYAFETGNAANVDIARKEFVPVAELIKEKTQGLGMIALPTPGLAPARAK